MQDAEKSAQLVGRLERLKFSSWHRNLVILAVMGVLLDAADFALFGAALPPARQGIRARAGAGRSCSPPSA